VDRIAPSRRPEGKAAGTQKWRDLAFLHWEVDAAALRSVVPRSMELDAFEGRYFVGVIPFLMRDVRVGFVPLVSFDFHETNVRTYVICNGEPGIYFFSLEASSWLAVKGARATFGLPYFHARMADDKPDDGVIHYRSERRANPTARHEVRYRIGDSIPVPVGSLEHFLVERYLLFVENKGRVRRAQVHHAPYPVQRAAVISVEDGLVAAAGLTATGAPLAHYSPGVDVEVFAAKAINAAAS
jgi:uncharacterized protein